MLVENRDFLRGLGVVFALAWVGIFVLAWVGIFCVGALFAFVALRLACSLSCARLCAWFVSGLVFDLLVPFLLV